MKQCLCKFEYCTINKLLSHISYYTISHILTFVGQGSSQAFVITAIISVTVGLILIISIASIIACCICKHYRRKQQERQHIFATAGETAGYGNVCHGEPQYHGYMGAPAYTNSVMPPPYTEAVSTPYQQAPTHGIHILHLSSFYQY